MRSQRNLFHVFSEQSASTEVLPFTPIIELAGNRRVLIENHNGIVEYCSQKIGIRVRFGVIVVSGYELRIHHMDKIKLIICGQVSGVALCQEEKV